MSTQPRVQKNYKIDPDLYRRAKSAAAAAGITINQFTSDAIREQIERYENITRIRAT